MEDINDHEKFNSGYNSPCCGSCNSANYLRMLCMSLATFKNFSSSFDDVILIYTMGAQLGHTLKTRIVNVFTCITWLINERTG